MKEVNLSQVICISLKSHNESQLDAIGATYNISLEGLLECKNVGLKKIWVHINGGVVIASLYTNNDDDIFFSRQYLPMTSKLRKSILAIKPVKTPKMPTWVKLSNQNLKNPESSSDEVNQTEIPKDLPKVELNIDLILDKINLTGMSSLTSDELNFLKNLK